MSLISLVNKSAQLNAAGSQSVAASEWRMRRWNLEMIKAQNWQLTPEEVVKCGLKPFACITNLKIFRKQKEKIGKKQKWQINCIIDNEREPLAVAESSLHFRSYLKNLYPKQLMTTEAAQKMANQRKWQ